MSPRLPIPGSDAGTWGDILNEYLGVEHNADGTLKSTGSLANKADLSVGKVPTSQLGGAGADGTKFLRGDQTWQASTGTGSVVLATSPTLGSATLTSPVINTGVSGTAIDTDGTLTANSDTKIASQKATKTYVDSLRQLEAGTRTAIDTSNPGFISVDVSLAGGIAGGDTLTGGTGSAENLALASTAHATQGSVHLLSSNPTYTSAPAALFGTSSSRTITANYASQKLPTFIQAADTRVMATAGNSGALPNIGFDWAVIYKNASGVAANLAASSLGTSTAAFRDNSVVQADNASVVLGIHQSIRLTPTFQNINGGTITSSSYQAVVVGPTVDTALIGSVNGLQINNPTLSNGGTITNLTGLNITSFSAGTAFNLGIVNASGTAFTPKVKTITATTDSISVAATDTSTVIRLDNTSGASKTLASVPTISNGQAGQILILYNSSAQDVVLQRNDSLAGSNLRLGAITRTLGQFDTLVLMYDSTNAEWVELAFTNNA